jgi:hypothetical protein
MLQLRQILLLHSEAGKSESSPEIAVIKDTLPIVDAGYMLSDALLTTDQYHAELNSLWALPNKLAR